MCAPNTSQYNRTIYYYTSTVRRACYEKRVLVRARGRRRISISRVKTRRGFVRKRDFLHAAYTRDIMSLPRYTCTRAHASAESYRNVKRFRKFRTVIVKARNIMNTSVVVRKPRHVPEMDFFSSSSFFFFFFFIYLLFFFFRQKAFVRKRVWPLIVV